MRCPSIDATDDSIRSHSSVRDISKLNSTAGCPRRAMSNVAATAMTVFPTPGRAAPMEHQIRPEAAPGMRQQQPHQ